MISISLFSTDLILYLVIEAFCSTIVLRISPSSDTINKEGTGRVRMTKALWYVCLTSSENEYINTCEILETRLFFYNNSSALDSTQTRFGVAEAFPFPFHCTLPGSPEPYKNTKKPKVNLFISYISKFGLSKKERLERGGEDRHAKC